MHILRSKTHFYLLVLMVLASTLSGCVKARMTVDVQPDGSGTMRGAMGMTSQAKALLASQSKDGEDPLANFTQAQGLTQSGTDQVTMRRWTDGDYEWGEATKAFGNLDELNSAMQQAKFFKHFSLKRETGFLKTRFILDAEAASFGKDMPPNQNDGPDINVDALIQIQVGATLPGHIIETNGIADINDSSALTWTLNSKHETSIHAVTETWNWLAIGGVGFLIVALLAVWGIVLYRVLRKPKQASSV